MAIGSGVLPVQDESLDKSACAVIVIAWELVQPGSFHRRLQLGSVGVVTLYLLANTYLPNNREALAKSTRISCILVA